MLSLYIDYYSLNVVDLSWKLRQNCYLMKRLEVQRQISNKTIWIIISCLIILVPALTSCTCGTGESYGIDYSCKDLIIEVNREIQLR